MTKDKIIKALEFCTDIDLPCERCPYDTVINCADTLKKDARELIIEQEQEIEQLKSENERVLGKLTDVLMCVKSTTEIDVSKQVKQAKIDVLNELKEKFYSAPNGWEFTTHIDEMIEELQK